MKFYYLMILIEDYHFINFNIKDTKLFSIRGMILHIFK